MFKEAPQTVGRTLVKSIICEDLKESIKINDRIKANWAYFFKNSKSFFLTLEVKYAFVYCFKLPVLYMAMIIEYTG